MAKEKVIDANVIKLLRVTITIYMFQIIKLNKANSQNECQSELIFLEFTT